MCPFRAQFDLRMTFTEVVESKRISAGGQASVVVELEPLADDETGLTFNMEISLLGKLRWSPKTRQLAKRESRS